MLGGNESVQRTIAKRKGLKEVGEWMAGEDRKRGREKGRRQEGASLGKDSVDLIVLRTDITRASVNRAARGAIQPGEEWAY